MREKREEITIPELRAELGWVSRQWVYDHIDPIFPRPHRRGAKVEWSRRDVYAALASAAAVSVGQEWHDFARDIVVPFADEDEMMYLLSAHDALEADARRNPTVPIPPGGDERIAEARRLDAVFMSHFTADAADLWQSRIDSPARNRARFVRIPTPGWVSESIRSGRVGERVCNMTPPDGAGGWSTEMRYRDIWDQNMARVEIFGVVWYLQRDDSTEEIADRASRPLLRLVPAASAERCRARGGAHGLD